jgi:hypothetical protein
MLRAALTYSSRFGFAVFPCWPRAKIPATAHGCKEATGDPRQICAWWQRHADANLAIATGPASGIVVLDVDPPHHGDESLQALEARYGSLPETPQVLTGYGFQFYFRQPVRIEIPCSSGALAAGIDVRGTGGYVLAPPSVHVNGRRYAWEFQGRIDEVPLAAVPDWLLRLMASPTSSRQGASSGQHLPRGQVSFQRLVAGIPEGERDQELFRLACSLRHHGYSREFALEAVLDAAHRCHPAFPENLARRKVASAWRYQDAAR